MARKVRHVHARSNEYIAVHRGSSGGGGGSSAGNTGCLTAILCVVVFYLVIEFWYLILTVAAIIAVIYFWNPICSFSRYVHSLFVNAAQRMQNKINQHSQKNIQQQKSRSHGYSGNNSGNKPQNTERDHPYGKIIQYKD